MLGRHQDPIVAIATAPGRGAVGIVRLSGRGLAGCAEALCGRALAPRLATYGPFRDAQGQAIDHGLALFFPAPHSYTGEDVIELQAHGGPVVLQLLLARCLEVGAALGVRLATPGEFTERAFLNGKLDLAQAEAVADLIDASTEAAARSASRSLTGAFSDEIHALQARLTRLRMVVEATLDFPEEEIDFLQRADAAGQLTGLRQQIDQVLLRARQGALLREGITVVLAGQPNVGKSSLLNALAGIELAIVTPVAGTTRDKVAQTVQIEGVPVHIVDTAGLRDTQDEVERIGVSRSWAEIERADALLFLHDLGRVGEPAYDAADAEIADRLSRLGPQAPSPVHVFNKCDLVG
ncbi:MAG: tRNA uridine-5-carboxymethylaminomethyl(34) synthesis GTPase MnmE, partial [Pseudomonadota bacterium]